MNLNKNPDAGTVLQNALAARGALVILLNVDGGYEVSASGLSYIEALGLLEAAKDFVNKSAVTRRASWCESRVGPKEERQ